MFFDKWGSDDWRIRRRIIILTLLWAAGLSSYLAVVGPSDQLREATVTSAFLLIGSIIGSYVFGVIWEQKGKQPGTTTETAVKTVVVTETPPAELPPGEPRPPESFTS